MQTIHLNPLILVTADVDWLPLHYMYVPNGICIKYFDYGGRASYVSGNYAELYPLPTHSLRSFVEEGVLGPISR